MLRFPGVGKIVLILALLPSCMGEAEQFNAKIASFQCDRLRECEKSFYEKTYEDHDDCTEAWEVLGNPFANNCEYNPAQARTCVRKSRSERLDCSGEENLLDADACEGVYTECSLFK